MAKRTKLKLVPKPPPLQPIDISPIQVVLLGDDAAATQKAIQIRETLRDSLDTCTKLLLRMSSSSGAGADLLALGSKPSGQGEET